ncbi:MAG: adenosylmethionine--8-amino-7-oxononanoate transaminase [Planctomycetota bacterium]
MPEILPDPTWYPFTQMREHLDAPPLSIVSAKGCWLFDAEGNRYLDGVSSLWANLHGHRHPAIDRAVRGQLGRAAHTTLLGLTHPGAVALSRRLVEIAPPGLARVFYSDSGATAVEAALKLAFQYMRLRGEGKRTTFIHLGQSYHGDTLGAVSVGGIDLFHKVFGPLLHETVALPAPHRYRHPEWRGDEAAWRRARFAEAERVIEENAPRACALIVEPLIQAAGGMLTHPDGYLAHLRALTRRHGLLLIADEVATGFGRTGRMFACEHEGVSPDLLCLGKGLTGGYLPLAATLATEEVFSAFLGEVGENKTFFHGHTYTGNPLGCAAALASLDVFANERVLESLPPKLARYAEGMRRLATLPHVGDVRFRGFMGGVELAADEEGGPYPPAERRGRRAALEARRRKLLLRPLGDVVVVLPPLSISLEELDFLFAALEASIRAATST